jgi:hypothetical protein
MMAVGHVLHYGMGVPQRKVPEIIEMFTGVRPTQSAFNQDAIRRSEADLVLTLALQAAKRGHRAPVA